MWQGTHARMMASTRKWVSCQIYGQGTEQGESLHYYLHAHFDLIFSMHQRALTVCRIQCPIQEPDVPGTTQFSLVQFNMPHSQQDDIYTCMCAYVSMTISFFVTEKSRQSCTFTLTFFVTLLTSQL